MANINVIVKRKQFLWAAGVALGLAAAVGVGWYVSQDSEADATQASEPAPDLTGVVDNTFGDRATDNAIANTQAAQAEINKQFSSLRQEIDMLSKARQEDQKRISTLEDENRKLSDQTGGAGQPTPGQTTPGAATLPPLAAGVTPEGEPMPSAYPPVPGGAVPPPTAFYPGRGDVSPPAVDYKPIPVPGQLYRKVLRPKDTGPQKKKYPYIPTGSFAKSMLIEGADANASVIGNTATVPMQARIIGRVEMPNGRTSNMNGCFVSMEAYGDVSSERAIVRLRKMSCMFGNDIIDQPLDGHVSFMGKNGVKGEVVMRNGKVLGFAWGAGFLDGIGQGVNRASQQTVGVGAVAGVSAGDVLQSGVGGGVSKAAQTLSDYYIKRAEQYHPVIPIGAGNEITVVFHEGFQLKTLDEMAAEEAQQPARETQGDPSREPAGKHLNGFSTDDMMKKLGNIDPSQFGVGTSTTGER
ncbi:F-type conjugal transfer pilus assembly protein TraB [Serratia odorifera]|uniref:Tat pathway signal sequence domain protein n=2 Tax=Serratia odorifera TaxID=618 RepID=D4EA52_SEROD|nr:F-type conjugal transfer pilus assembly protein TraB [Serratia odorifera]EFE93320.1 Tat pathway signal sequence domain protein [Serratia odorifera DSM 4582]PNK88305.1 conjugal transfer protein TrbI [Serratia odorifera]RII73961.1 conjugal transfer protein TrbI [Serratia odorifera]VDZ51174.1 conjugal transfer pilus assembly protein TraB [Serratia odorifera]